MNPTTLTTYIDLRLRNIGERIDRLSEELHEVHVEGDLARIKRELDLLAGRQAELKQLLNWLRGQIR